MGEVYRAVDTRLDREVAIKILPAEFSQNAQLKIRFEREAKAISGLTHPHICTLYDVGHDNGHDYLVLELLEGESLADRLAKGPLPIEQVLRIGAQIAEALEKAHRHGVVHRDLKPGNIMLTKSGAKLLDFGLAKTSSAAAASNTTTFAMNQPTEQRPLTQEGTIVGTFQYMAPEQLEGSAADARTDIFALGVVLYEMATGRRAFDGKSRASLIASILDRDPEPISAIQPLTPPSFERLVYTCMRKDPDERWQSAHDVAAELRWIAEGSDAAAARPILAKRKKRELVWIAAAILFALIAGALAYALLRQPRAAQQRELRAEIGAPPKSTFELLLDSAGSITVSPDGKWITFDALDEQGDRKLFLRPIDSIEARPLESYATYPFWSPDSRSLAFFSDGKLRRIDVAGGPATVICDASEPRGGTWNEDGTIVFNPHWREGLYRVSAQGGKPELLTKPDEKLGETTHRYPVFLPDGEHYLYLAGTHLDDEKSERNAIYIASLKSNGRKLLLRARSNVLHSAGHLLFVRGNFLLAQPFDSDDLELAGEPRQLAKDVYYEPGFFRGAFGASDDGLIVFGRSSASLLASLRWRTRDGKDEPLPGEPVLWRYLRISPDQRSAVAEIGDPADLWIHDLARGVRRRLTSAPLNDVGATFSPDGRTIAYASDRNVVFEMFLCPADGSGTGTPLMAVPNTHVVPDVFSRDGRLLIYGSASIDYVRSDIWALPMTGSDRKPFALVATSFAESHASISPDNRWLAFVSNDSGRDEIYVMPLRPGAARQQISTAGADRRRAMWSADGKELFYVQRDGTVMAVALTANASGETLEASAPQPLFRIQALADVDVARDGRFLVTVRDPSASPALTLITGWK
jgi:eukaryotic-like serine/threonine-protein kinase